MKLILCKKCADVFSLRTEMRRCACGATYGRYLNNIDAEYHGNDAVPIGFANSSLARAVRNQPAAGMGERFDAFVIPAGCETMHKLPWSRPANQA